MPQFTITLNQADAQRVQQAAAFRQVTPQQLVDDAIRGAVAAAELAQQQQQSLQGYTPIAPQ